MPYTKYMWLVAILLSQPAIGFAAEKPQYSLDTKMLIDVVNVVAENYVDPVEPATVANWLVEALGEDKSDAGRAAAACAANAKVPVVGDEPAWAGPIEIAVRCLAETRESAQVEEAINGAIGITLRRLDSGAVLYIPRTTPSPGKGMTQYAAVPSQSALAPGRIGIGLRKPVNGGSEVASLLSKGPAEQAGVAIGDTVLAVDDKPVSSLTFDALMDALAGPIDSVVTLSLRSKDSGSRFTRTVRRSFVLPRTASPPQVPALKIAPEVIRRDDIAIITIPRFVENRTAKQLRSQLAELMMVGANPPPRAIIFDLRNNFGGELNEIIEVADLLLDHGTILTEVGRTIGTKQHVARRGAEPHGPALYTLVDDTTTTGAEALAAALSDNARGRSVGKTTAGVGTISTMVSIDGKRLIKIPNGQILRPNGRPIGEGIAPDIPLAMAPEASPEEVLDAALKAVAADFKQLEPKPR